MTINPIPVKIFIAYELENLMPNVYAYANSVSYMDIF